MVNLCSIHSNFSVYSLIIENIFILPVLFAAKRIGLPSSSNWLAQVTLLTKGRLFIFHWCPGEGHCVSIGHFRTEFRNSHRKCKLNCLQIRWLLALQKNQSIIPTKFFSFTCPLKTIWSLLGVISKIVVMNQLKIWVDQYRKNNVRDCFCVSFFI